MKGRVKVLLTPLGNKIKYRIVGRVYCTRLCQEVPNSRTYATDDLIWVKVFGSRVEMKKWLKQNKQVARVLSLEDLGYDACDKLM